MRVIASGPAAGSRPAEAFHEEDRPPMPASRAMRHASFLDFSLNFQHFLHAYPYRPLGSPT